MHEVTASLVRAIVMEVDKSKTCLTHSRYLIHIFWIVLFLDCFKALQYLFESIEVISPILDILDFGINFIP